MPPPSVIGRRPLAAPPAPLTPVIAPRPSPLRALRGISAAEVRELNRHGVSTLEELAALDVDRLAALLPTQSVTRARFLHGLARKAIVVSIGFGVLSLMALTGTLMPVDLLTRSLEFGPTIRNVATVQILTFALGTVFLFVYGLQILSRERPSDFGSSCDGRDAG